MALGYIYPISFGYVRPYDTQQFLQDLQRHLAHVNRQINQNSLTSQFWISICSYKEKQQYLCELINAIQNTDNNVRVRDLIRQGLERFAGPLYGIFNGSLDTMLSKYQDYLQRTAGQEAIELAPMGP